MVWVVEKLLTDYAESGQSWSAWHAAKSAHTAIVLRLAATCHSEEN